MTAPATRTFNTAGPIVPEMHYHIPPLQRAGGDRLLRLVKGSQYFVVYAPRQTGKTTALLALRDALNAGDHRAVYANIEGAQTRDDDLEPAIRTILSRLASEARRTLDDDFLSRHRNPLLKGVGPEDALREALSRWARASPAPLVLLLDEVDGLRDQTLLTVLHQLRADYPRRHDSFPRSVALCGLRRVQDYTLSSTSPFNIADISLRLGDFSETEVGDLLGQHTTETGQRFTDDAVEALWDATRGQPWLVNALSAHACFDDPDGSDRDRDITSEAISTARERLILRRPVHFQHIARRLKEDRVRRIMEPVLAASEQWPRFANEDVEYVRDIGLIAPDPPVRVANPIYQEVIPRVLARDADEQLTNDSARYLRKDGSLDVVLLLTEFRQFFRENPEWWSRGFAYGEAAAQVLLQAFLQRVVNAGGVVAREYGLGMGRTDLRIEWRKRGRPQVFVIECKVRRIRDGLEEVIREGAAQTAGYMDRSGAEEGHLVIFDSDRNKSWEEKIFDREVQVRRTNPPEPGDEPAKAEWQAVPATESPAPTGRGIRIWGL